MGRWFSYCWLHTQLLQGPPYSKTILQPRKRATVYLYWRDDQRWEGGPTVRNVVHAPFPIDNSASEGVIKQWAASVGCCPPSMHRFMVLRSAVGWWNNGGPPITAYMLAPYGLCGPVSCVRLAFTISCFAYQQGLGPLVSSSCLWLLLNASPYNCLSGCCVQDLVPPWRLLCWVYVDSIFVQSLYAIHWQIT